MNILITGTRGLASALSNAYIDHSVTLVSRSGGYDIHDIQRWGLEFLDQDCVFNCAYDGFAQLAVLEFFHHHWKNLSHKQIINIGSRAITYRRLDGDLGYWPYRQHKQALQSAVDAMLLDACCDIKIINPGPVDTEMIAHQQCKKFDTTVLANKIKSIVSDPTIKRVDLWL
jgi:NAD(P)-dependent dehydrogenase (short-subunit alcohol dehydrogenase family)